MIQAPVAPEAPARGVAVHARALTHSYGRGRHGVAVLRGVDLDIDAGSHVALQGPSGAGKSTLLILLGGLEAPRSGQLSVGEHDLLGVHGRALAAYRRAVVGFVFQHFGLVEVLSARENVMLAMSLSGVPMAARRQRADQALESVGLSHRATHRPSHLSGGERQRVAIARAIVNEPPLLLADEPTGNLDDEAAVRILDLLDVLREERGCTLVVVTHSALVAARADRRLQLRDGVVAP
ncbi:MAG: ABC transporter ATP-binding protein [Candidatus Dormibacteraeota bacterium]|uniref:ABC transporter ATP-binding protein n=1 Tax=Candidatus Amunia macphersoniae TaxID=3127014 RepID=A0A934KRF1_9BACT|nr:ABC transporter ATP-binding protein [Candidatus Dormibacteraeota bacterium]